MPIKLTDLIARVSPAVEEKVRRTRDRERTKLQNALRSECRLVLRSQDDIEDERAGAQVPVEITPGHPEVLEDIEFPEDYDHIILLSRYRAVLEEAKHGVNGMLELRKKFLQMSEPDKWITADEAALTSTASWAVKLLTILDQYDPLKKVFAVRDDYLGVYQYRYKETLLPDEYEANKANILLYWGVIGLVSDWMGCTVEDLTVVVLAHELAHAYTQLGADIDGRRWVASKFAKTDKGLKEGLAQYYTERVLRRMNRRYEGALKVYEKMLPGQPEEYRTHLQWMEGYSPEAIRRAILEVRRDTEGKLDVFAKRLDEAQKQFQ